MKKSIISLILSIVALLPICSPVLASEDTIHQIDMLMMDTAVFIENGRTYAPAQFIAENFGIHVDWDYAMEAAILTRGLTQVYMQVGMDNLLVAIYSEDDVFANTVLNDKRKFKLLNAGVVIFSLIFILMGIYLY